MDLNNVYNNNIYILENLTKTKIKNFKIGKENKNVTCSYDMYLYSYQESYMHHLCRSSRKEAVLEYKLTQNANCCREVVKNKNFQLPKSSR